MEATVPYEESGWYDGQVWIKPPEILLQDRLIGTYEIYPGLKRLEKTFAFGEIQIIHKLSNSCKTDHLCMNHFASNSSTLYRLI